MKLITTLLVALVTIIDVKILIAAYLRCECC
jgi:hypothetical protein